MEKDWQWMIGVILAPLAIVFVANTWEQGGSAARDVELRHSSELIEIRNENTRQTDRLSELGKLNAETAARLESLTDRQSRVERKLEAIEQRSWGLGAHDGSAK
jgi:hypothetical protein